MYLGKSTISYRQNDKIIEEIISNLIGSGAQFSRLYDLLKHREGVYELFEEDTLISFAVQSIVARKVEDYLGIDRGSCSVETVSTSSNEIITECVISGENLKRCFSFDLNLTEETPF